MSNKVQDLIGLLTRNPNELTKFEIRKWQQRYAKDTSTKSDMLERNVHTEELKSIATDLLAVAEKLVKALS